MRIPVLYGTGIDRDFSTETKYIVHRLGSPGQKWDGMVDSSIINPAREERLSEFLGQEYISLDPGTILSHSMGKSSPEILMAKHGEIGNAVRAVVFPDPKNIDNIVEAIRRSGLSIIPYGGGTSVNGSLKPTESSGTVSMDMSRFNWVEIKRGYALAGAGVRGIELESKLWKAGLTCGNFPESFQYSTVGGWVATGATGQESNQYGGIENIVLGVKLRTGDSWIADHEIPRESVGMTAKSLALGMAGRTGIITDVYLRTFPIPSGRRYQSFFFHSFLEGIETLKDIDVFPTVGRLSDTTETEFAMNSPEQSLPVKLFKRYLLARGLSEGSMFIVINNGSKWDGPLRNAISSGPAPARSWERDRYMRPGLARELWKEGFIPDTLETSATWERLPALYTDAVNAFYRMKDTLGFRGEIMAHLSHLYSSGACIYFTFILAAEFSNEVETLARVRDTLMKAFLRNGGSVTHHHGIGSLFTQYLDESRIRLIRKLRDPLMEDI